MSLKTRLGADIVGRIGYGAVLLGVVVALFLVPGAPWVVLPVVLGIAWWELIRMSRLSSTRRVVIQAVLVYVGIVSLMILLDKSKPWAVVLAVAIIVTDIGAFTVGRLVSGRVKRPPRKFSVNSPNKTWAGVIGGCLIAGVATAVLTAALGLAAHPLAYGVALAAPVVAVWGDLFESRLKRVVGIKDTSRILGPHGGMLDRLDSVVAVFAIMGLPLAVLL